MSDKEKVKEQPNSSLQLSEGQIQKCRAKNSSAVADGTTRGNSHGSRLRRFGLDVRRNFTRSIVQHWNRLLMDDVSIESQNHRHTWKFSRPG